jgi:hypothetical protein
VYENAVDTAFRRSKREALRAVARCSGTRQVDLERYGGIGDANAERHAP